MDRQITSKERNNVRLRTIIKVIIIVVAIIVAFIVLKKSLNPVLDIKNLDVSQVDEGDIAVTINASGVLAPMIEEIIVSPISSRILEVYKNPGDSVNINEPILKLQVTSVETEYNKKLEEMEVKKSKVEQNKISAENNIASLEMQQQIKEMHLKQYYNDYISEIHLDSIGASTTDKVRKAELNYEQAKLELNQLKQKIENERKSIIAELRVQELELSMFNKTLQESARILNDAQILSPQKAILTFINTQIGSQVSQGGQLAIIADMSSFKVDAEIADRHADKLSLGAQAVIKTGDIELSGSIINISPAIQNGIVKFTVMLDDANHPGLRSGVSVDVNVLWGVKSNVLRVANGSFYKYGKGNYDLWVIRNGEAVKTRVQLGDSSFEYVEVISGLSNGDKVITSDIPQSLDNKKTLKIK